MDEVHIAQFVASLRTLSKLTQRQVIIAVHGRVPFGYPGEKSSLLSSMTPTG